MEVHWQSSSVIRALIQQKLVVAQIEFIKRIIVEEHRNLLNSSRFNESKLFVPIIDAQPTLHDELGQIALMRFVAIGNAVTMTIVPVGVLCGLTLLIMQRDVTVRERALGVKFFHDYCAILLLAISMAIIVSLFSLFAAIYTSGFSWRNDFLLTIVVQVMTCLEGAAFGE